MKTQLIYIGKDINLKVLEKTVAEHGLGNTNKIMLNPQDYNSIVVEHTQTFKETLPVPYTVHGVVIEEDNGKEIPYGTLGIT